MRRSHHKLSAVKFVEDKKSGEYKLSHHVDLKSGYYNGKKILDILIILKMTKKITIAIDAMGGENAPKKNIEGLNIFLKKNIKNDFYYSIIW